jgi:hypothetical protein
VGKNKIAIFIISILRLLYINENILQRVTSPSNPLPGPPLRKLRSAATELFIYTWCAGYAAIDKMVFNNKQSRRKRRRILRNDRAWYILKYIWQLRGGTSCHFFLQW